MIMGERCVTSVVVRACQAAVENVARGDARACA